MSAAQHTPGPWWAVNEHDGEWGVRTLRDHEEANSYNVGHAYGASICHGVGDHTEARTRGNEEANARLIAASPDLLEALESAVAQYGKPGGPWNVPNDPGGWLAHAQSAIAKARGQCAP